MYARYLQSTWWTWLVSGLIGVLMGLLFLNYPGLTFAVLTVFFGIFALLTGLVYVIGALANRKEMEGFWSTLFFGLVALVIGIATFVQSSSLNETVLLILVALYFILFGLVFVLAGWEFRKEIRGEFLLILLGIFALLFGFFILFNLQTAGTAVASLLGLFLLINGVADVVFGFKVRSLKVPAL
jgi:uncharacterized membrane protein HdeD (DUF308 family)